MAIKIQNAKRDRKKYMPILLLADEQENAIEQYLHRGDMYLLDNGGVKAECIVTDEGNGILELKSIAVLSEHQHRWYGRYLVHFIVQKYKDDFCILRAGTGDSPLTIPFYRKCGFTESHRIKNFFTDHYDHPIFECGIQLIDMVYLERPLMERPSD